MAVTKGLTASLESEYAVLGSLLIVGAEEDKAGIRAILSAVREEDFQSPVNRELYQAARDLFRAGKPVDGVTLRECCGGKYGDYLLQLMEITPTAANWREYAEIMREKAILRQAADLGRSLAASQTLEDCRRDHAQLGQLLSDGRKLDSWGMPELLESFFQSQDPEAPKPEYITFGLSTLDKGTYIQRGDVVILGGYPSDGKTCLALQMAWHMAVKHKVGFFSLETNKEKLRDRLMAHAAQLRLPDIKDRTIPEEDWTCLAEKAGQFSKRSFRVIQTPGMTAADIQSASEAYGFDIIFIDYVQLIKPETPRGTMRSEQMASVSRDLHTFAQTSGTLIIELAQLTRPDQGKWRVPNMHDLKESGQFEQDADVIFLIYQPKPKSDLAKKKARWLTIGKNKEGLQCDWPLDFDGEKQTFSVMPEEVCRAILRSLEEKRRKAEAKKEAEQHAGQVKMTELTGEHYDVPF